MDLKYAAQSSTGSVLYITNWGEYKLVLQASEYSACQNTGRFTNQQEI